MRVDNFVAFISAREDVYLRRASGAPKPWTDDPILLRYRFCNVQREHDTVTRWVATNWRQPHADHPDLFFAMAVARFINWPDTLDAIGFPLPWRPEQVLKRIAARKATGEKVWTGAYIVSTNGVEAAKDDYVVNRVLAPLHAARASLRPVAGDTLASFAARLGACNGFKGFMTGQVIADLKYAQESPLRRAPDWHTWAVSGPGSRRGLNRVCGNVTDANWNEYAWRVTLLKLQLATNAARLHVGRVALHAQDVQNCLCEFDKYERVRLGEGRPRSMYPGS